LTLLSNLQRWWIERSVDPSFHQLSDEALLQAYQAQQSSGALNVLINRHSDALYHFLLTLSDASAAEDICQHTWLKIIEHPSRYQFKTAQFRSWLFTTARNALIDELRRKNRWQWSPLDDLEEHELNDWQEDMSFTVREDLQAAFNQALADLPFAQKEALMLQLDGFSLTDIADITHEKPETIKSRLRFARQCLKSTLEVAHESQ